MRPQFLRLSYCSIILISKRGSSHETFFKKTLNQKSWTQLIHYLCVGGVSALVEWGTFSVILSVNINYLIAVFISFIFATGVNYWLCKRFIFFHSQHVIYMEATLIYLVSAIGLILNILLMWLMVDIKDMHPIVSKVPATGTVFIWNFISRKFWVFGKQCN